MIKNPFLRTFSLGVKSLLLHKLRSGLTTLGMLFGVSSVVAMLAIGEGASIRIVALSWHVDRSPCWRFSALTRALRHSADAT